MMDGLVVGITLDNLMGNPSGPRVRPLRSVSADTLSALLEAGLTTVQYSPLSRLSPRHAERAGLTPVAALTWQMFPGDRDLDRTLARARDQGFAYATLLCGGNLLSEAEALRRAEALLEAQRHSGFVVHLETHRSTLTESIRRTQTLVTELPELTLNLDLSHWFVSHRLDQFESADFIEHARPLLRRCRFLHGRVSSATEAQVPLAEAEFLGFFRDVWGAVIAEAAEPVCFAPELLPSWTGYARHPAASDRWLEALELVRVVREVTR